MGFVMNEEYEYVTGQGKPDFPQLFESFERLNEEEVASGRWTLDYPYGESPKETIDFSPAKGDAKANLIYLHPGYWQSRDKAQFRFIAKALNTSGINVALVNYPLCPNIDIDGIVKTISKTPDIVSEYFNRAGHSLPMIVAGHSAGGHLAVELALKSHNTEKLHAVVAISGIFDLMPIIKTTLNVKLQLDARSAYTSSPLYRVREDLPPAVIIVGIDETEDFKKQSKNIVSAWIEKGNYAEYHEIDGNHFSLLKGIQKGDGNLSYLFTRALSLAGREA